MTSNPGILQCKGMGGSTVRNSKGLELWISRGGGVVRALLEIVDLFTFLVCKSSTNVL